VKDGALATLLDRDGEPDGTLVGNLLWEEGSIFESHPKYHSLNHDLKSYFHKNRFLYLFTL
jgi:hypothetical protein